MDENYTDLLMNNEMNLVLYCLVGLVLVLVGVSLPSELIFLPGMAVGVVSGLISAFYGCKMYLKRRKEILE